MTQFWPSFNLSFPQDESDDDDGSDDDEEEDKKPAAKKEPEPEAEPELVIKNNKNKKAETPQKGGHNKSFNGQAEGKKIFVHNVSEEATYEDFQVRLFVNKKRI